MIPNAWQALGGGLNSLGATLREKALEEQRRQDMLAREAKRDSQWQQSFGLQKSEADARAAAAKAEFDAKMFGQGFRDVRPGEYAPALNGEAQPQVVDSKGNYHLSHGAALKNALRLPGGRLMQRDPSQDISVQNDERNFNQRKSLTEMEIEAANQRHAASEAGANKRAALARTPMPKDPVQQRSVEALGKAREMLGLGVPMESVTQYFAHAFKDLPEGVRANVIAEAQGAGRAEAREDRQLDIQGQKAQGGFNIGGIPINLPAGGGPAPTAPDAGQKPAWQQRADQLKAQGLTPPQVAARLREEGLIQ